MQFELAFIYLTIWLLMLWLGAIALEATGMERSRAHFQALSALSGTGFTTKDAETVVSHSTRRWIVTWMMFFGNAGFIMILILIIVSVQSNLHDFSAGRIILIALFIVVSALFIWLGMLDKVSTRMVRLFQRSKFLKHETTDWDLIYRDGNYGIFKLSVHYATGDDIALEHSPFYKPTIRILSIERDNEIMPFPDVDEKVMQGDVLLCYGKIRDIIKKT